MAASKEAKRGRIVELPPNTALDSEKQEEFEIKVKEIKKKKYNKENSNPGVIYLGHIPHGFYEEQMKSFFSQFGKVNKIKISRSKRTGKSKGYAFVQLQIEEVAKIVAETMNNYFMFEKLVKCEFLPMSKVHPETFKGCNRAFSVPKAHIVAMKRHNKTKSDQKALRNVKSFLKGHAKKVDKLKELGIDYKFNGLKKVEQTKEALQQSVQAKTTNEEKSETKETLTTQKPKKEMIDHSSVKKSATKKSKQKAKLDLNKNTRSKSVTLKQPPKLSASKALKSGVKKNDNNGSIKSLKKDKNAKSKKK